jgi:hypothetical protein
MIVPCTSASCGFTCFSRNCCFTLPFDISIPSSSTSTRGCLTPLGRSNGRPQPGRMSGPHAVLSSWSLTVEAYSGKCTGAGFSAWCSRGPSHGALGPTVTDFSASATFLLCGPLVCEPTSGRSVPLLYSPPVTCWRRLDACGPCLHIP